LPTGAITRCSWTSAGLRRTDICDPCWQKQSANGDRPRRFISHWQECIEAPPPVWMPLEGNRRNAAAELIEQNDPRHAPAGYILASCSNATRPEGEGTNPARRQAHFIYEAPEPATFLPSRSDLHLDQLEQVQRDVAACSNAPDAPLLAPETNRFRSADMATGGEPVVQLKTPSPKIDSERSKPACDRPSDVGRWTLDVGCFRSDSCHLAALQTRLGYAFRDEPAAAGD